MRLMTSLLSRGGALALFAVLAILSACTVVVEEPGPIQPGPYCTREYNPVCARRGGQRETFDNGCLARAAGFEVVRQGECRRQSEPAYCTREYNPVCARRGNDRRTFGNACEAEAAGYNVNYQGECRRGGGGDDRVCTQEYAPVCGQRGNSIRTFGNACQAESSNYRVIGLGPC